MGKKREFTIEGCQFKIEPRDLGGHYANHKNPRYDVFLIAASDNFIRVTKCIGTCMTLSEGFIVASDYVKQQKAGHVMIPDEKALEAYSLIRKYCMQFDDCKCCAFLRKDGDQKSFSCPEPCIFGAGFYPSDWD